ncbi:EIN3-binding F-box protein 2-like [Nymphaea colorata]|nr:EIN3-binding F-box protein 2-like [Nymphaea colorata]
MSILVNRSGDEDLCQGGHFTSNFILSPSPSVDVDGPPRKRSRISDPLILRNQEQHLQKAVPSIEILPDECLFEILRRVSCIRDRSACACVSKRWLLLQSSIRRSEIVSRPNNCNFVNVSKMAPATNTSRGFRHADSGAMDVDDEKVTAPSVEADDGDSEEGIGRDDGYLTRFLQGKKSTDVRLAAISIGTVKLGGLGKLLIRGTDATRGVTDVGLSAIARGCPSLKVLSIWDVPSISDASLCEIAQGCHQLEKLDLSHCPMITDRGLVAIAENCPNLSSLTLESCPRVRNEGLQAIGRSCSNLQSVNINDCPLVGDQGVASLVACAAGLVKIRLQALNISDLSLAVIGHYAKSVTELSFMGLQYVGERGFWALGNARGLKKLKSLAVSFCKGMTDSGLEAIGLGCPVLKHLCLRRCFFISDNGLCVFARAAGTLESLQLEECNQITQTGILSSLSDCKAKLKTLSLVKCMGIKDQNGCLVPLPVCNSVRSLTIRDCPCFGSQGLAVVGKVCPQLQHVDFSGLTGITDSGVLSLMENCRAGLVKVNLSGCINLTDDAITHLTTLHGGSLQLLNLGGCRRLSDESLKVILANCPSLQDLDMSKCSITDHGIVSLPSCGGGLPDLQVLSLSGCSQVSDKSVPILRKLSSSLVGLNLQRCNLISNKAVGWLGERMWRCDILS